MTLVILEWNGLAAITQLNNANNASEFGHVSHATDRSWKYLGKFYGD